MKKISLALILLIFYSSFGQTKSKKSKFKKSIVQKEITIKEKPPKMISISSQEMIFGDVDIVEVPPSEKQEESNENNLYNTAVVEVKPEFPGGMSKFLIYLNKNYTTPAEAIENGISGKVYASFTVEKEGSITDIKIIREIGYGTGAEALRVLKNMPKWLPAQQNGKKVRCTYLTPIQVYAGN